MHGDLSLNHTKIGTKVSADLGQTIKQRLSYFFCKLIKLFHFELLYVCCLINPFYEFVHTSSLLSVLQCGYYNT